MPTPTTPLQNSESSLSAFTFSNPTELKIFLLQFAAKTKDRRLRLHLKKLANITRRDFEGYTPAEIRQMLLEQFRDYSDGRNAQSLTVYDLKELTGINKKLILPVLETMVTKGDIIETEKIPDFHQFGDHGERSFRLNLDKRRK